MKIAKAYVVIPVYNESKYIKGFSKSLFAVINKIPEIKKAIFVNDGSIDNTQELLTKILKNQEKGFIINHKQNLGKGEAMKTGLSIAKKENADAVIFIDGDRQHDPEYISKFLYELKKFPVVFGYRLLSKDAPFVRRTGNLIAGFIIHNLFGIKRKDLLCGFMALRKDIFNSISWESKGYGVEAELSALVGRKKINFSEVLISTIYLDARKGVTLNHAFIILLKLPKWYFKV